MATKQSMYQMKYDNTHRRVYGFRLHNDLDKDIIDKLASVPNMQGYIKQLIRDDIARTCPGCVPVPFNNVAMEILVEKANETGKSVPELIALIVNEQLIRTEKEEE